MRLNHKNIDMSIGTVYERAYKGDFNQVKVKIDENKSIVLTPDTNSRLLIHWAALSGNENLVDYLIDKHSPVDPVDDTGSTPLILAASAGRFEVARLLIGKGANVDHKTNRRQTALHYACSKGHKEIVQLLLSCDASVNEADVLGATPLHRAAAQGRTDIVDILLKSSSIHVDLCDSTGCSPLYLACEEDREATAVLLVKAGANINLQNKEKQTPIDICSSKLKNILKGLCE